MALKDWENKTKERGNLKDAFIYVKKDRSKQLFVGKPNLKKRGWDVTINGRILKENQTKQQALKYAREYMKKH